MRNVNVAFGTRVTASQKRHGAVEMYGEGKGYQKYIAYSVMGLTKTMEMPQSGDGMPEEIVQAHINMTAMAKMDRE